MQFYCFFNGLGFNFDFSYSKVSYRKLSHHPFNIFIIRKFTVIALTERITDTTYERDSHHESHPQLDFILVVFQTYSFADNRLFIGVFLGDVVQPFF
jgi:hypothetical protein